MTMTPAQEKAHLARFRTVPLEKITQQVGGFRNILLDYYWLVTEDECVWFYGTRPGSPQANMNKLIVERLASIAPHYKEIRLIPFVSLPHNCHDY